jgi:hypothetical protein
LGELVQRGQRSLPRLPAFHAAQTPGEIVDKGQRLAQVDIAGVLQREQAISSQV